MYIEHHVNKNPFWVILEKFSLENSNSPKFIKIHFKTDSDVSIGEPDRADELSLSITPTQNPRKIHDQLT